MADYYDRDGKPMTLLEWAARYDGMDQESIAAYKRVAETTLPDGRWVSTVWLGLNHSCGDGPPLIFETMVFTSRDNMNDLDCDRYSTEAEALAGHQRMVEKWSAAEARD